MAQIFVLIYLIILHHVHLSRSPDVRWWVTVQDGAFPVLHQPHAEVHHPSIPWGLPSRPGPNPGHWLYHWIHASQDICSVPSLGSAIQDAALVLDVPASLFCILPAMIFCQALQPYLNHQPHYHRGFWVPVLINVVETTLLPFSKTEHWHLEPSLPALRSFKSNLSFSSRA